MSSSAAWRSCSKVLRALLGLDGLERAKRAAGRPKDLLDLEEIRALKKR